MADQHAQGVQRSTRSKYLRASSATSAGRRKWSDWSECTENCIRARHRLNCDDLTSSYEDSVNLQSAKGNGTRSVLARRLQARSGQDEDPDYADEGDEEDEDDSCANVETSKTFEEQVCSGGQCKSIPDEFSRPIGGGVQPIAQQQQQQQQHSPRGQHRARSKAPTPTNSANSQPPMVRPPNGSVQKSTLPSDSLSQQSNHRTNVAANRTAAYIHKHSDRAETRRGIELVQAVDGLGASESAWPPRGMWPPSTNATEQQQQQQQERRSQLAPSLPPLSLDHHRDHSLQLALVVAAAIFSLVLVAALLIGRLFAKPIESGSPKLDAPNWMRAAEGRQRRRRRKSHGKLEAFSSGSSPSSSCRLQLDLTTCQQALLTPQSTGHGGGNRLLCPSSYTNHNHNDHHRQPILIGQQLERLSQQQSREHQQEQFCYFWERKRQPPKETPSSLSFAASLSHLAQQFGPSKAQRLDSYQRDASKQAAGYLSDRAHHHHHHHQHQMAAHQSQVGLCSTSSTCSSSTGSARRVTAKLISQYNNQLQSGQNQLASSIPICHFDSLYVEPNTIAAKAVDDYENYDTLDECNQMATTSSNKQPPKVPPATSRDADPTGGQLQASTSSSSLSVLSATAQLVSNEANGGNSSSLDQAPEIVDCLQEPADITASSSRDVVAASALVKRRQYHMSAGADRLRSCRKTVEGQQIGDTRCDTSTSQQHFYEEINRM